MANPLDAAQLPVIQVCAGDLHIMATKAEAALIAADTPFYCRGERIVRPIVDEVDASRGRRAKVARLKWVDSATLVDHLSRTARWERFDVRKKAFKRTDPPSNVAGIILARDGEWNFRPLAGVITTPTLRPDGSLLLSAGYDEATRLLLMDPPKMPRIPDRPTRSDAMKALEMLSELLVDFPFVDNASRSVALSSIITPVVRGAMKVAPMHCSSAPVAGSGKSFIIDLASTISTGERAPVIAAGRSEEETEKRLGAALLAGQAIVSIDNVNGELGGDALCQMIERPIVSVRPLGVSQLIKIESRATIFATGNNIHLVGDMTRRVVLCSLDPNVERPELRSFRMDPIETVLADRGKYVAAALVICRAYVAAGYPGQLQPLASFEEWSRIVRSALVWLGQADPCESMAKARADDPQISRLSAILSAWHEAAGPASHTCGTIKEMADRHGALKEALLDAAENKGMIDPRRLGYYLSRHAGRIIGGLKIAPGTEDSHNKQKRWKVVRCG